MDAKLTQGAGSLTALEEDEPFPGVTRRVLTTARATVSHYKFQAGAEFPLHSHPQEQITLIEGGSVQMVVAGEPIALDAGSWSVVESGVEHGITAGDDGATVVAIISPPRGGADEYEVSAGGDR